MFNKYSFIMEIKIKLPTKGQVTNSRKPTPWTFGNKILYELCRKNFTHKRTNVILAKTLIIGRAYSVALDRNKREVKKDIADNFYLDDVVPLFKKMKLSARLSKLKKHKAITCEIISPDMSAP